MSCRKLILEKLPALQNLDTEKVVQAIEARCHMLQGPAEQSTLESGRKIPSTISFQFPLLTKFNICQLAKENFDMVHYIFAEQTMKIEFGVERQ